MTLAATTDAQNIVAEPRTAIMALNVVLELLTGPEPRTQAALAARALDVGRTERADFVSRDDARMSSLHFTLRLKRTMETARSAIGKSR